MRLDKFLSDMNAGTRKELKTAIRKKRVTVNGEVVRDAAMIIRGDEEICFDGRPVIYSRYEYYMMNKPAGVLSSTSDRQRSTVLDLMDSRRRKDLFPAGRLDIDTEGLILITNDGELTHRLLAPRFHVDKVYYAVVSGRLSGEDVQAFAAGLKYDEDLTAAPAGLRILPAQGASYEYTDAGENGSRAADNGGIGCESYKYTDADGNAQIIGPGEYSRAEVTIHEGKFHQIKKMFAAVGKTVLYLKRISFGPLSLDPALAPGEYRPLTADEIEALKHSVKNEAAIHGRDTRT